MDYNQNTLRFRNLIPSVDPNTMGDTDPYQPDPFQVPRFDPLDRDQLDTPVRPNPPAIKEEKPGKLKSPSTPRPREAQDAYLGYLRERPKEYQPSRREKFAALAYAFTGDPNKVDRALYGRRDRELNEFEMQGRTLGNAANLERLANQSADVDEDRTFRNQVYAGQLERQTREDESERIAREAKTANDTRRVQNQTDALNGGKVYTDRSGNMWVFTKNGQVKDLDKEDLSFQDKLKLQQEGRLTIVNDQQEAARFLAEDRQRWEQDNIRLRAEQQRELEKLKNSGDALTPNEIKVQKANRVAEYVRLHPEQEDWIQENEATGAITMRPPTIRRWTSDANAASYRKAIQDFNNFVDKGIDTPAGAIPGVNQGTVKPGSVTPGTRFPNRQPPNSSPNAGPTAPKISTGPTPPPLAQRSIGDKHTFTTGASAGKTGTWNGSTWSIPEGSK